MLRGETQRISINFAFTPELPADAVPNGDARVTGEVTDQAGYMRLTMTATVSYHADCARCLEPVDREFSVSLERTVAAEGSLTEEQLEENVDEYAVISDGKLDLGDLVREELF